MYFYLKKGVVLLGSESRSLNLDHDDIVECSADETVEIRSGVPTIVKLSEIDIPPDVTTDFLAAQQKSALRDSVRASAGDVQSLLGSAADAAQILLFEVGRMAVQLNQAESLAQVRSAAQPLADLLGPLVQKIADGDLEMPYQVKGVEASLQDIEHRATCVADVLKQSKEQNNG